MIIYHDNGNCPLLRDYFAASGVECVPLWRDYSLRYIDRKIRARMPKSLVSNVPEPARSDDKIIVFDTQVTPSYLYWLCRRCPDRRIILWYWNPAPDDRVFDFYPRKVEIWSYSPADCARYGFRYNSQFYFDCIAGNESGETESARGDRNDGRPPSVCFIGREKGRKQSILKIKEELERSGIATDFHFMEDGTPKNRSEEMVMPYAEVVGRIKRCDALLDYTLKEDAGLSLRPMEALFLGRKLITNQKSIARYDFYRKENIYILGEDERPVREFLDAPGVEPAPEIRDYYLLSRWLKRFDEPG